MVHDHVTRVAQTVMPPTYIKVVVGLASVIPLIAGVRNIVAPGTPLSFIPEDDVFQAHLHGSPKDPRMAYVFQLFGCCLLYAVAAKLLLAFGHSEGTYLRRQIMVAYGVLDFVFAYLAYDYWPAAQKSVVAGFALMHCVEGSVFLGDALLRPRPVKIGKGRNFSKTA